MYTHIILSQLVLYLDENNDCERLFSQGIQFNISHLKTLIVNRVLTAPACSYRLSSPISISDYALTAGFK